MVLVRIPDSLCKPDVDLIPNALILMNTFLKNSRSFHQNILDFYAHLLYPYIYNSLSQSLLPWQYSTANTIHENYFFQITCQKESRFSLQLYVDRYFPSGENVLAVMAAPWAWIICKYLRETFQRYNRQVNEWKCQLKNVK